MNATLVIVIAGMLLICLLLISMIVMSIRSFIKGDIRRGLLFLLCGCFMAAVSFAGLIGVSVFMTMRKIEEFSDIKTFPPENYSGEKGGLKLAGASNGSLMFYDSSDRLWSTATDNGTFVVPAGKIRLYSLSLSSHDSGGGSWSLTKMLNCKDMEIKSGAAAELPGILPATASISSCRKSGKDYFDFSLLDAAGEKITIYGSGSSSQPRMKLLDKDGKSVFDSKFDYG